MAYGFDPGMLSGRDMMYAVGADRPAQAAPQGAGFGGGGFTPPAWNQQWLQTNRNRFMRTPGRGFGARQQLPVQGADPAVQRAMMAATQQYQSSDAGPRRGAMPPSGGFQPPSWTPPGQGDVVPLGGGAPRAWDPGVSFQGMPQPQVPGSGGQQLGALLAQAPVPQQALQGLSGAAGGPGAAGMVPMYQFGQMTMQKPMYDPYMATQGDYQNVGGFNMAPDAAQYRAPQMDMSQMANTFMEHGIAGQALDTGRTQQMNAGQALGTSLQGMNAAQVGSPEVQALLQQLALEAQYQQAYGQPMYQSQQYGSRLIG